MIVTPHATPMLLAGLFVALLFGVWLAYPACVGAIVGVLGLMRRKSSLAGGLGTPRVTCILATRESGPAVRARIANLLASDYDPLLLDVVVGLDRNARCHPGELADLSPRVSVVRATRPGKPSALNAAVAAAEGDVLVFADTYQVFEPDAIRHLVDVLGDPAIGAVSGNLERGEKWRWQPVTVYWRLERWLRLQESSVHSCVGVTGAIYAMRATSWRDLPGDVLCDDLHVPMRLVTEGKRVVFEPAAIARDARDVPAGDEFRRKVRTLTGNFQLVREMPDVMVPWRNPIWLQFVCHKLLRLLSPYFMIGILLSCLAIAASMLPTPFGVAFAFASTAMVVWLASPNSPHSGVRSILLMFAAALVAGWHAASGDWGVWTEGRAIGAGGRNLTKRSPLRAGQDLQAVAVSEE